MQYVWRDYDPKTMGYVEHWLDAQAVKYTGLEDGFRDFYEYWAKEEGYAVRGNFWCKAVFENDAPLAVIAFSSHESNMVIMEIVVAPEKRGQGHGAKILKELLKEETIIGFAVERSEAVIFPGNEASQRAFEKAEYQYHHMYEDKSAVLFVYERGSCQ